MTTPEEVQRRVADSDASRSTRRAEAAKQIFELAQRRTAVAQHLEDVERQLGEILTNASEDIAIDELARFTDIPVADLTRWRDMRPTARTKRRKTAGGATGTKNTTRRATAAEPTPPRPRDATTPGTADTPAPTPMEAR
ncbi:hypothetical protein [Allokutzneria albata]|uniref:Uncharacterized protein n=1 Tax=Allokutzneria albata TaxID=211114 RepID=A0A1G9Y9K9_ALLAB|nr:hypothetical protein [Allokutzneria albata]SDN05809.1 hypothetical protein SAMN04489726_4685 [Allokutzneria albata]